MNKARLYIWLLLYLIPFCQNVTAQDNNLLQRTIQLQFPESTLLSHIDNLYLHENIELGFNSSRVDLKEIIKIPKREFTIEEIIRRLFYHDDIELSVSNNKIVITFINKKQSEKLTIKGYIKDSETGEALVGASISDIASNSSTFSNESGFYSLTIPAVTNEVLIHYIGYKSLTIRDLITSSLNISLEFDNLLDQIVIESSVSDNFLLGSGSEKIDLSQTAAFQSTSGDNDLINAVRISPKVQSGNEGQVGLYVRGGSPDQNLILFDGIPLYEVSHTAGFSSIFIEESIKDIDFITNGFPARYGGRLSSVMNVRLKEGNQSGYNGSVKMSLPAMKAHIEGPLFSPKTTFNISGRLSYVDKYLNQLIGDIITYDNIDLNYYDFIGKLTHRFSNTQKLSVSYYDGNDKIGLRRINTIQDSTGLFQTDTNNSVSWGSTVWNATFTNVISDKFQIAFNAGGIKYKNDSEVDFRFRYVTADLESNQELELRTHSEIEDQLAGLNIDYYFNDQHRFKFGASWIHHKYNPALIGNDTITEGDIISLISTENNIQADELSFYIEDTYTPHENLQIYGGVHFSGFNTGTVNYRNTQPRFNVVYSPDTKNRFTASYSSMIQYVHLLVNPGIGLPSDFWVPSTETVNPESARQFSLGYSRKLPNSIELSLSGYSKYMKNVLEYRTAVDLFFKTVNSDTPPTIQVDKDWQNSVIPGESSSNGVEFQVRKTAGTITGWFSYAWSKTDRLFENINENKVFPYKYDRRHDINVGVNYNLNKSISISANWVYGTGNAFSLALEEFKSPFDLTLINGTTRNNLRFPAYSHLDLQFNYKKVTNSGAFTFNLGLYNAYNRKNAYYIYIYDSPLNIAPVAYKTSLFPILPNMSLGYSF